ncbi:MAG: hypothetical protein KAH16_00190 [Candidatus Izimaplasma sp.]|nr:hypothetical protein [Candidatus Izimaplasma bacterium]
MNMMLQLLFLFMIYVVVGWLWETPYVSLNQKKYINRGFLRGPYIPIYGFACLTIILSMDIFETSNNNSLSIIIIQILYISLISAVWEYLTSWGLEKLFKTRWWDYSNRKFNLNGRVALDYTILFGVSGYLLWRFVNPIFESIYSSITPNILLVFVILFYTFFLIDGIYTFKDLFKLRDIIIKLNNLKISFAGKYDYIFEKAYSSIMERDEGFVKALGDYKNSLRRELSSIRNKGGTKLALSIENKAKQLNTVLLESKSLSRFFSKYPKAPSKSYSYLLSVLRNEKNKNNQG